MTLSPALSQALCLALDDDISACWPVSGGDVAEAFRVDLASGATVFAKTRRTAHPEFFDTEARGLRWLQAAQALPIPKVVHVGIDVPLLVLEWIDEAVRRPASDVAFGKALAALHHVGAPCFGREDQRTTGSRGLPNEPCATWADFYATNRLLPLARLAADEDALPPSTIAMIESIAQRLDEFGAADEQPARLHGDLWAGNRIFDSDGQSWLIDPAAHGGHREFDLAMMQLFGGWADDVFAAYDSERPLGDGWRARVGLHQLAPLAVHAIKFGGGYVDATTRAATMYC